MPTVKRQTPHGSVRGKSAVDRIKPVSLCDERIRMNIFGRSGTGKTTLACTFPKPLLLIGAEDGKRSVRNVKGVDFIRIDHSKDVTELAAYCRGGKYQSVVLDTLSSYYDMILAEVLGLQKLPEQKSWGMASRDQYGQAGIQVKERLRELLLLDCHLVILAQQREFNNEEEGEVLDPYIASAVPPSVVRWLNPAVDYIGQTYIRQQTKMVKTKVAGKVKEVQRKIDTVDYVLRTYPDPVYTTKFRAPKGTPIPKVLVDPTFEKIEKIANGN